MGRLSSAEEHEPFPTVLPGDLFQIRCLCGYETPLYATIKGVGGENDEQRPRKVSEGWKLYRAHWARATRAPAAQKKPRRSKNDPLQSEALFDVNGFLGP